MPRIIQVPEYGILRIGSEQHGIVFEKRHWKQLFRFHDEQAERPYFDMLNDGVRFSSFVGVIQAGDLTVEILPKVDDVESAPGASLRKWRDVLLRMLHESGTLRMESVSNALLREKENSLLDVYLGLFLSEVEALLHRGLVKRYRHTEGQQTALRGTLQFGKHLAQNLVHQERFFTRHQTYDRQHLHNVLIRQALLLLPRLTASSSLRGRTARALVQWAETPSLNVTASTFTRLTYDRKTEAYRPALVIARLLLLNHRPDLRGGDSDLVALLFNMNTLWEQYLLSTLQRLYTPLGWKVTKPRPKTLWSVQKDDTTSRMQPDILIELPGNVNIVLDAKWKRPNRQPSGADLRQLYAYAQHYNAKHAILLYPQTVDAKTVRGIFEHPDHLPSCETDQLISCSTVFVQLGKTETSEPDDDGLDNGFLRFTMSTALKALIMVEA